VCQYSPVEDRPLSTSRTFEAALTRAPVFFEPVPPSLRTRPDRVEAYYQELAKRLQSVDALDAIDVPELIDENHDGRPYYRTADPREIGRRMATLVERPVVVNKVVAHLSSEAALVAWAQQTLQGGIRDVVLVGGSSRYIPYPGPQVIEADRACASILRAQGGHLGNIAIPQRQGEAHRMLAKTRAGASFFTTQILFDSESLRRTLQEYDALCQKAGVPPAAVLLSVAPLADESDAEFVRWLGADIPEAAERWILNGDESSAGDRAIEHARRVWTDTRTGADADGLSLAIGVNVEQLTQRHLDVALRMLSELSSLVKQSSAG
jgi:5,10-methylenetetrahydrofolate reductase